MIFGKFEKHLWIMGYGESIWCESSLTILKLLLINRIWVIFLQFLGLTLVPLRLALAVPCPGLAQLRRVSGALPAFVDGGLKHSKLSLVWGMVVVLRLHCVFLSAAVAVAAARIDWHVPLVWVYAFFLIFFVIHLWNQIILFTGNDRLDSLFI